MSFSRELAEFFYSKSELIVEGQKSKYNYSCIDLFLHDEQGVVWGSKVNDPRAHGIALNVKMQQKLAG